jgi:hypothetical protein
METSSVYFVSYSDKTKHTGLTYSVLKQWISQQPKYDFPDRFT